MQLTYRCVSQFVSIGVGGWNRQGELLTLIGEDSACDRWRGALLAVRTVMPNTSESLNCSAGTPLPLSVTVTVTALLPALVADGVQRRNDCPYVVPGTICAP